MIFLARFVCCRILSQKPSGAKKVTFGCETSLSLYSFLYNDRRSYDVCRNKNLHFAGYADGWFQRYRPTLFTCTSAHESEPTLCALPIGVHVSEFSVFWTICPHAQAELVKKYIFPSIHASVIHYWLQCTKTCISKHEPPCTNIWMSKRVRAIRMEIGFFLLDTCLNRQEPSSMLIALYLFNIQVFVHCGSCVV